AARKGRAKAAQVRAAVDGIDIVGEGVDAFGEAVVVLQGDFDLGVADASLDIKGPRVQRLTTEVQVAYERDDAALKVEAPLSLGVGTGPLVDQRDAEPLG